MIDFNNIDKTYFIGEVGINHNGDLQIAKKLIDATFACSWDCVKFQKRNPNISTPDHQKNILRQTPWGEITYLEYKNKIEFNKNNYNYIDKYCKEKPISWSASIWDFDSLEFVLDYNPPFIKIPSAVATNKELVEEISKTKLPIIISTGMCNLRDVDNMFEWVNKYTNNLVLMHTNSSYPTPKNDLNISLIPFYKERYNCTIGYSGHEQDLEPTVLSVLLGAKVIERHITLSHDLWGTDQKSSLSILAMDMLYKRIKDIPLIIGKPKKEITPNEELIKNKLRKRKK